MSQKPSAKALLGQFERAALHIANQGGINGMNMDHCVTTPSLLASVGMQANDYFLDVSLKGQKFVAGLSEKTTCMTLASDLGGIQRTNIDPAKITHQQVADILKGYAEQLASQKARLSLDGQSELKAYLAAQSPEL